MVQCTLCGKETDLEYTWIKARYHDSVSAVREEKIPILGRNYRADESPEVRKVGEIRYYFSEEARLTGGVCDSCMAAKRRDDGWFRWPYLLLLAAAAGGLTFGGDHPLVHLLSLFLLFMTLVGQIMRFARFFSHNDRIRVAEAMESYFLDEDKGGDGQTITKREFLYRPVKSPDRFVLFPMEEWDAMGRDEKGTYLT